MKLLFRTIFALITISLVSNIFIYIYSPNITLQVLNFFSPDGIIAIPDFAIKRFFFIHALILILSSACLIDNLVNDLKKSFNESGLLHKVGFIVIFFLIFFYFLFYFQPLAKNISNFYELYNEDGFFENITAIFFFCSTVLILFSIRRYELLLTKMFKVFFGLVALFLCLEEISWGQRLFDIEVPIELKEINSQNELNIHNIYNDIFPLMYASFSFIFFAMFFFSQKISKVFELKLDKHIFPKSGLDMYSFITFFLFLTCILMPSHYYDNELLEEVYSVIFLIYSLDQFRISNSVKIDHQ